MLASKLGVAEARVHRVDGEGLGRGWVVRSKCADEEDFKQFGDLVSVVEVGGFAVDRGLVESGENGARLLCWGFALVKRRPFVHFGGDNGQRGSGVECLAGCLELGDQGVGEQEGGHDVDGDGGFVLFKDFPFGSVYPCVQNCDVDSFQLFRCRGCEVEHGLVG